MIIPTYFYLFFFFITLFLPNTAQSIESEKKTKNSVELLRSSTTEFLTFEKGKGGIIIFRGGVILKFKDNILQAEIIKFNPHTGEIFGQNNVKWQNSDKKIEGDFFFFDNETQTGILFDGKTNIKPLYYHGDSFQQLKKDHYLISFATFTTCDLEKPHYSFKAKKVWIYPNNKLVALHIIYQVSDIPIFYWPLIFQTDLGTGIRTLYGYNEERGHYLQNTYYFNLPFPNDYYILPEEGKLFFDYYQYTGELYGLLLNKKSKHLSYELDMELANFRRKNMVCDTIFTNTADTCTKRSTNFFLDDNVKVATKNLLWWKIYTKLNGSWVNKTNFHSKVVLEITDLKHRNFEPEFGRRIEPKTTLDSIYFDPTFRSVGPQKLNWLAKYNFNTENTSLNIKFQRTLRWNQLTSDLTASYLPIYDTLPSLNFLTRYKILAPTKKFFSGSWLIININGKITRIFTEEIDSRIVYQGESVIENLYQFSWLKWLNFDPNISYGLRYQTTTPQTQTLNTESKRQSYHYLIAKAPLRIGSDSLHLQTEYEYQYFILRESQDLTFNNQGNHFINLFFKGDFHSRLFASVETKRDLRDYPYPLAEQFLWAPLKISTNINHNFYLKKKDKQISDNKVNFYISWNNIYQYLIRFDRHGTNNSYFNFGFRNIKLGWTQKINQISFSLGWHHSFIDLTQDNLNFKFKLDVQLFSDLKIIFETQSKADQFERYAEGVNFFEDLLSGFNPFSPAHNDTVFNLDFLRLVLEHQLHQWVLKVYYERYRKTIFWGGNLQNQASFYQQNIYLSLTLTDFDFFEKNKARIYRNNPGNNF